MRWIIRFFLTLVVLALLAVAAIFIIPAERIAAVVTDRMAAATGRDVVITGEVRPTLWPHLGIRAEGLRIGNPDWVAAGPLIAAETLNVGVDWTALLAGEIRLQEAELAAPDITLVRAADGRVSWDFGDGAPAVAPEAATPVADAGAPGSATPAIGFDRAVITGGRLRWIDEAAGQDITVAGLDAEISLPDLGSLAAVVATAEVNGTTFGLDASIDGLGQFLEGAVRPIALTLDWTGGEIGFDGRVALAPALDGDFLFEATDLGPVMALAGSAAPVLPEGLGRDRMAASGRITLASEGSAHLRSAMVTLDGNTLSVDADILPGTDRPMIRGSVATARFDLPGTTADNPSGGSSGGSTEAAASGWSRAPIDVSGLFAVDAEMSVSIGTLDLGAAVVDPVELTATLDRGRLVLDIARVGAYGGRLTGQFVVNGRGGLSVGGDLIMSDVQLNPLLTDFAGWDRLEGSGSASLQFLGVGNDLATLMNGLEGQGDVAFGAGAIIGLDIAGMILNLDPSYQGEGTRTVYDRLTANFTIADGIVANDDLLLDGPWGEVQGEGTVGLGAQTVDYILTPGVMRDDDGATTVQVPVRITGPWASPRIYPDLERLAEMELEEQRERLEAEAEARLAEERERLEAEARERANEVLGTQIEEGQGREEIEQQLQERLMEEAGSQLQRLLGGGN